MALFLSLVLNESIHFYVQHTLHSLIWKKIFLIRAGRMEMKWVLLNTVEKKLHHKCVIWCVFDFSQVTCPAVASLMTIRSSPALETPPGELRYCTQCIHSNTASQTSISK